MDTTTLTTALLDDLIRFYTVAAEQRGDRWSYTSRVFFGDSAVSETYKETDFMFSSADEALTAGCGSCERELVMSQLLDILCDWIDAELIDIAEYESADDALWAFA